MQKKLYITEKPSVALNFAEVIGIKSSNYDRNKGYLEKNNSIITWCYGHLITMAYPDEYSKEFKQWNLDNLPIIPKNYKYKIIDDSGIKRQFETIKKLMNRDDVKTIYSCTDSGREGEYIFRLVYDQSKCKKEVKRVWISSYTNESILKGINEAKDISEYDFLGKAAYNRAKEDWLFGMNFSRVYSVIFGNNVSSVLKESRGTAISVGRVMTCVLGLVALREDEIRFFKPVKSYGIKSEFESENSKIVYIGKWEPKKEVGEEKSYSKKEVDKIIDTIKGKTGKIINVSKKKTPERPPLLFNLSELQSVANRIYKIPVNKTLEIAQNLYEKKLISYPRTDSKVLTEDIFDESLKTLKTLYNSKNYNKYLVKIKEKGKLPINKKTKRYVDNKKVTDHYAIIPTYVAANLDKMDSDTRKIYDLIVRRFLAIFFTSAIFFNIKIETKIGEEIFVSHSKELIDTGWKEVFDLGSRKNNSKDSNLNKLVKGENSILLKCELDEKETKAPPRYTEGTLVITMEKAGKFIEDEELREQIKTCGIGTSATRAGIIKKLSETNKYIQIDKKSQIIKPTLKGETIYELIKLTSKKLLNPEFTASWEKGLMKLENNETSEDIFNEKLHNYIKSTIKKLKLCEGNVNLFRLMKNKENMKNEFQKQKTQGVVTE